MDQGLVARTQQRWYILLLLSETTSDRATCKKQVTTLPSHHTQQSTKQWVMGLNISVKTTKFLQENTGENSHGLKSWEGFLKHDTQQSFLQTDSTFLPNPSAHRGCSDPLSLPLLTSLSVSTTFKVSLPPFSFPHFHSLQANPSPSNPTLILSPFGDLWPLSPESDLPSPTCSILHPLPQL